VQAPQSPAEIKGFTPSLLIHKPPSGGLVRKTILGANGLLLATVPKSHEIRQHSIME